MTQLSHLFTPIKLRNCEIKNRILVSGHVNGLNGLEGLPTERELRYHEARAKGGFGLIVMQATAVNAHVKITPMIVEGWTDAIIPRWQKIADAVHAHGAKIMVQIWHNGHHGGSFDSNVSSQAPSQIVSAGMGESTCAMTKADIREVIGDYVATCLRAQKAGLDGVELHAGHGYLPQQFLSPYSNIRTDEYGGSLENRLRFSMELIDAVRAAVGDDFVVGMRMTADEFIRVGLTLEDMKEVAPIWAKTGKIDYLNVTMGTYRSAAPMIASMAIPAGAFAYLASEIRQTVDIPVFAAIRINDPVLANDIIATGKADMCVMTRASIADPELPNKAKAGRFDEIRQCIACNEGCWERCEHKTAITCMQNPEAGREGVFKIEPTSHRKKVLVVGGGPAGMKAAAVAKERGHEVVLYEKSDELGGSILIPATLPARAELGQAVRFLTNEIKRLGVKVVMNTEITAAMVLQEKPDAVIIATGSQPFRGTEPHVVGPDAAIEVEPGAHVVVAEDVLQRKVETGQRVVVADFQNYMKGMITAEFLADQGKEVTLIMPLPIRVLGQNPYDIDGPTHALQLVALRTKKVTKIADFETKKAAPGKVTIRNIFTEDEEVLDADTLVTSYWRKADTALFEELEGQLPELHRIGDCVSSRRMINAIYDGYKVGMEI